jgi:cbb3-type cytochrome oxidase subunit 1
MLLQKAGDAVKCDAAAEEAQQRGTTMHGIARNFFTLAIGYAIAGMILGLAMSISHDHAQMPTHAHIMVAGWLMSAVFAFFYQLVPAASASRLAPAHFWLTAVSGVGLVVGLFFLLGGNPGIEPFVAASSIGFFASLLLFAWIALRVLWKADNRAAVPTRDATAG